MPSWCCTSCAVTVSWKVSASAARDSPTGSSTQTSSSGNCLLSPRQLPARVLGEAGCRGSDSPLSSCPAAVSHQHRVCAAQDSSAGGSGEPVRGRLMPGLMRQQGC